MEIQGADNNINNNVEPLNHYDAKAKKAYVAASILAAATVAVFIAIIVMIEVGYRHRNKFVSAEAMWNAQKPYQKACFAVFGASLAIGGSAFITGCMSSMFKAKADRVRSLEAQQKFEQEEQERKRLSAVLSNTVEG